MKKFLPFALILTALSCSEKQSEFTYFGGEIVNPKEKYIHLVRNEVKIDSALLDEHGRFLFQFENDRFKDGLYRFEHYPEIQWVILEKGDSLLLRLNTFDFDESLVFSGPGAEKNNFLIDMFLLHEDEQKLILKLNHSAPETFEAKIDSLQQMKWEQLEDLSKKEPLSALARHVAEAAITYQSWEALELYPFDNKLKNALEHLPKTPEHYYKYREQINYNDTLLRSYLPYFNFLKNHFDIMAYQLCDKKCRNEGKYFSSLHYGLHKLTLIDSMVQDHDLKEHLLLNSALTYLFLDHNPENNQVFVKKFMSISTDPKTTAEIRQLYENIGNLQQGKPFPEIEVVDLLGDTITLKREYFNQPTVFYFWSANQQMRNIKLKQRIDYLKREYPDVQFIGLNVDKDHQRWVNSIKAPKSEQINFQYRISDFNQVRKDLVIYYPNRIVVVNKNGELLEGFGNLYNESPLQLARQSL